MKFSAFLRSSSLAVVAPFGMVESSSKKIESLLTDHLNNLVYRNLINLKYFYIRNKILGITNPGDEVKLKDILSN